MFNLGFTMEELMFPENYQSNFLSNTESDCLFNKFDKTSPADDDYQEQIIIDDDDWFTIKELNQDTSSNDNNISLTNDQTLPLLNIFSDTCSLSQLKSMVELDSTVTTVFLPNLSIKVAQEKSNTSSVSNTAPTIFSSSLCDERLSTTTTTIAQQQSNKHMLSKSTSSLSFRTHSSTSMTSSSADEMSLHSNDLNELAIMHHSTNSMQKLSHHHHHKSSNRTSDDSFNSRRRRKRTIFSTADIEHLKEAFIQNPKPSQQDIAILSEQLGHDSYVIRVWFYNKRQATKKRH